MSVTNLRLTQGAASSKRQRPARMGLFACLVVACSPLAYSVETSFDSPGEPEPFEYDINLESDIPEVLTTTRLCQPKSRVPGTINIITRAPADTAGAELRGVTGSRGHRRVFGSVGGSSGNYD